MKLPQPRIDNIIVQKTGTELLVYDLTNSKAYCLNETSANVYNACGSAAVEDLIIKHNYTEDLVYLALDELKKQNLLADDSFRSPLDGMSRREAVKRAGLASMAALPVIASLLAPTAASAQSRTACVNPGGMPAGSTMYSCFTVRYGLCQAGCEGNPRGLVNCCSNRAQIDPRTCPPGTDVNTTGCSCICA